MSVHFGQLITIMFIKFYELSDHLYKIKGRIVYRGNCSAVPVKFMCHVAVIPHLVMTLPFEPQILQLLPCYY